MSRALVRSPGFVRDLKKWIKAHPETVSVLQAVFELLAADPATPSLRTHKLRGNLAGC